MFVNVFPRRRLPRSLGPFTYRVPARFQVTPDEVNGAWVRVPFRGTRVDGIVWSAAHAAPRDVARVADVEAILPLPKLTREQRLLVEHLWERTFLPIGTVLWALIPQRPRTERGNVDVRPAPPVRLTVTRARHDGISAAAKAGANPRFVRLTNLAERVAFILALLRTTRRDRQTLILTPTHDDAVLLWSALLPRLQDRAVLLTGALTPAQRWASWGAAAARAGGVFVCTKAGVLAPFARLASIVIDRASDDSHAQSDQNPRYDARSVARELARLHGSRLVLLDVQPTLTQWADPELQLTDTPPLPPQTRVIVHRPPLGTPDGDDIFSAAAEEQIATTPGPVIVFHNRRGYATLIRCRDCGWMLRCATCTLVIGTHRDRHPHCHRCGTMAVIPERCPTCGGTRLTERGLGVERIADTLRERFRSRRVATLDRETDIIAADVDILVATERVLYRPFLPAFSLLVVPSVDAHLLYPDVRTVERAYLLLERAAALCAPGSSAVFQTYDPTQPIVRSLRDRNPTTLYSDELELRRRLSLPPAARVFRLLGNAATSAEISTSARTVLDSLRPLDRATVRVSPALAPVPEKQGKRYRRAILVTVLSGTAVPDTLARVLMTLPDNWFVDPEPLTLNP